VRFNRIHLHPRYDNLLPHQRIENDTPTAHTLQGERTIKIKPILEEIRTQYSIEKNFP